MLSICIITNKQNQDLQRAIDSVYGLGEIVVVDTKGGAPQIYLPNYYAYPWHDDFAAARNYALDKARGDIILSLDADEWVDEDGRRILGQISKQPPRAYFTHLIDDGEYKLDQVKIFPKHSDVRYIGRVHEQILPSITQAGIPVWHSNINIYHDGYSDPEVLNQKHQRNLRISSNWLSEEPHNPWAAHWYSYIRGWDYSL